MSDANNRLNLNNPTGGPAAPEYQALSEACLNRALASVPGYESWRTLDPGPSVPVDRRYAALPHLTKQQLRDHFPKGFIPADRNLDHGMASGEIEYAQTSGSTDDRVTIVFHARWWEASEQAAWQLNAHARRLATGSHREAVLASPRCVGPGFSPTPLSVRERTLGRHLYLNQTINPASWSDEDVRRMAAELAAHQPVTMEADPAYLAAFALRTRKLGLQLWQPQLIFLTYSYPSRIYKRIIGSAFSAPQASSYGSTETGHVFMQCEAGRLHQNVDHCRVDFEPWTARYGRPDLGRILVTVFHNPWFTVLRFDIGDVARLDARGPCPCGRHAGLTLAAIDGRIKDVTFAPDGTPVTIDQVDAALSAIPAVDGWQLDHLAPGHYQLRILADPLDALDATGNCRAALSRIYGSAASIAVQPCDRLEHEPSGKFRFARTTFPVNHDVLWQDQP